MPKNYESGGGSGGETPLDKKCEELIWLFEHSRYDLDDFRNRRNYQDHEIDADQRKLDEKMSRFDYNENAYAALDQDKVLEAVTQYMGNHGQIFTQESFAEPGSEYDDFFNGADIVFGLPQPNGERDVVFNVDACTATNPEAVAKKFYRSDTYSHENTPGCNSLRYYAHEKTRTRINPSPHYIIGTMPARISEVANKFDIDGPEITNEVDENFRRKILAELFIQSQTGYISCLNVPKSKQDDRTKKAYKAHKAVNVAAKSALIQSFGLEQNEETDKLLSDMISDFVSKNMRTDDTFATIWSESIRRNKAAKNVRAAQRANAVATKLKPDS